METFNIKQVFPQSEGGLDTLQKMRIRRNCGESTVEKSAC